MPKFINEYVVMGRRRGDACFYIMFGGWVHRITSLKVAKEKLEEAKKHAKSDMRRDFDVVEFKIMTRQVTPWEKVKLED